MKKWILLVLSLALFSTLNSYSGTMSDELEKEIELKDIGYDANSFLLKTADSLRSTFVINDSDITFKVYETFFRRFIDGYQPCILEPKGEDFTLIRSAEIDDENQFQVSLLYPFLTDKGCDYKPVNLKYELTKLLDQNKITFSFENDYGYNRLAINLWIFSEGYKSIVPLKTTVSIEVSEEKSKAFVRVKTESMSNIPKKKKDEKAKTIGLSLESHNEELLDVLEDIIYSIILN